MSINSILYNNKIFYVFLSSIFFSELHKQLNVYLFKNVINILFSLNGLPGARTQNLSVKSRVLYH